MEVRELKSQKAAEQGLISKEDHEALRLSLQAEINAVTARFNDLTRKHEKTCTEVCVSMILWAVGLDALLPFFTLSYSITSVLLFAAMTHPYVYWVMY